MFLVRHGNDGLSGRLDPNPAWVLRDLLPKDIGIQNGLLENSWHHKPVFAVHEEPGRDWHGTANGMTGMWHLSSGSHLFTSLCRVVPYFSRSVFDTHSIGRKHVGTQWGFA